MEKTDELEMNVQYVKGVGPKKAELLNKLGIYQVKDLLEYYPRSYEDRTKLKKIEDFCDGESTLFIGTVCAPVKVQKIRRNLVIISTVVRDETGTVKMTWYNQAYIKTRLEEGNAYLFYGKAIKERYRFAMESSLIYSVEDLDKIQGIYPIYPLTAGITQNYLFKLIRDMYDKNILVKEIFPDMFRKKYGLPEVNFAMRNIHFPKDFRVIEEARNRIIFEELFLFQLALVNMKNHRFKKTKAKPYHEVDLNPFLELLPFELTSAQKKVVEEIKNDLTSTKLMSRLVQGDVGSGKTMVAALAMYMAVKNGYQVAMMAPTTILAMQHYDELSVYFEKLGIHVGIITSSTTKKNKNILVEKLKNHELDIVIGTHSLIEDPIEFSCLGMVITDEQHRFGVKQRMKLAGKGNDVETLVMTATPIPRTLAIILYGDLDLSIIDEMPPGRRPVITGVRDESNEEKINHFLKSQIEEGRQIYVVCPLVEENEELNLNSVEVLFEKYKNELFKEYHVEFLHGKMKNKEKDEIMQRFKNNEIQILISTTVIEVGISVSNATVMVIENADRFGLAALHQLRGRVGRGKYQSYCILKSSNKSVTARERLKIMEKSNSGFEIAQKDLELRGPGDFFGIRQSGMPEFKLANLLSDVTILKKSQDAVNEIIAQDSELEKAENQLIKEALYQKFGEQLENIQA